MTHGVDHPDGAGGRAGSPAQPQISLQLRTFNDSPEFAWHDVLRLAQAMDAAGVDRVVVSDHVAFGDDPDAAYRRPELGGAAGGRQPTGPDGQWLEPMTVLTAVAATTSRIRLGTAILLAALRRPVVLAKQAATLDVLSGGRLDIGVGVGWQREEYEAAGVRFEDRGRLLDHTLEVCRALWTQQRASYDSPELRFEGIHQMPKPVTPGGVPIWVSGTVNPRVARRLARFGVGWIPWGPAAAEPGPAIAAMRDAVRDQGGDPTGLQVQGTVIGVRAGGRRQRGRRRDGGAGAGAGGGGRHRRPRPPPAPRRSGRGAPGDAGCGDGVSPCHRIRGRRRMTAANAALDRLALRELVDAYALAVDVADGEAAAALFTPDGELVVHLDPADPETFSVRSGRAEIASIGDGLRAYDRTHHTISSTSSEVDGDRATGRTRCEAHHLRDGRDLVLYLRYDETFRRVEGTWRFTRRELHTEWSATISASPGAIPDRGPASDR